MTAEKQGKGVGEAEEGAESTCSPPTGPAPQEKDREGRDALGRWLPGVSGKPGGGRSYAEALGYDERAEQSGIAAQEHAHRILDDPKSSAGQRNVALRVLAMFGSRRVGDRISEERSLSHAAERRLIEILDGRPIAALREAINVRAIDVSEEAEPITVRSYKLEGEPGGSEGDEDGEEGL